VGPDLTNIGLRQPNEMELLKQIYNARMKTPKSVMPPYKYMFYEHQLKPGEKLSPDAFTVPGKDGYEIFPREEAKQLTAYLLSLHSQGVLFETPPPPAPPTNSAKATATNVPAATNAPATTPAK
jgi:cytochrome c oxidase cbb3-type subunit 2